MNKFEASFSLATAAAVLRPAQDQFASAVLRPAQDQIVTLTCLHQTKWPFFLHANKQKPFFIRKGVCDTFHALEIVLSFLSYEQVSTQREYDLK